MSNPLRLIRKYQKRMMVFFGILLMISFIIGGALVTATKPARDNKDVNRNVVRWTGGKITRGELDDYKYKHQLAQQFLYQLGQAAINAESQPMVNVNLINVPTDPQQGDQVMMQILCLAREAENMGISISNETIDTYLLYACDQELNEADYQRILNDLTGGRVDMVQMREALRRELLAYNTVVLANAGLSTMGQPFVTPVQAYAYDSRKFRSAQVELYAYSVEDYLGEVSEEPSKKEIKALYEEGKLDFSDYTGERPGFRVPPKLHVQWLKPDLAAMKALVGPISDAEIQARYEEWKNDPDSPAWEIVATNPNVNEQNTEANEGTESPEGGSTTEPPVTNDGAGDGSSDDSGTTGTGDGSDQSSDDSTDTNTGDDQANATPNNETFFTSLQEGADANSEAATTENESQDDNLLSKVEQGATPPRPAASQPSATPPEGVGMPGGAQDPTANLPKPQLKELSAVRDEIIDEIKEEKARVLGWDKIQEFRDEVMLPAYESYLDYEFAIEDDEEATKPAPPKAKEWAEKNGFDFEETNGMVELQDFADTSLGQFQVFDFQYFQATQSFPTIAMLMASEFDSLQPFVAEQLPEQLTRENPQTGETSRLPDFVYWPVETQETFVPTLEQCRDEVVKFWKMKKALEIAKKKASEIAAKASSSSLRDVVAVPSEVVVTDPFTWMSQNNLAAGAGPPTLSEVRINRQLTEGTSSEDIDVGMTIDDLGNTFMESIFTLDANETGVAVSENRETVYAVKVLNVGGMTPSMIQETTASSIMLDPSSVNMAAGDQGRIIRDWLDQIEKKMKVVWLE